jgi:hypothetical protein
VLAIQDWHHDPLTNLSTLSSGPNYLGWDSLYTNVLFHESLIETSDQEDSWIQGLGGIPNPVHESSFTFAPSPSAPLGRPDSSSSFTPLSSTSLPLSGLAARHASCSQWPSPNEITHQVTPQTALCEYCGRSFSPQRLLTHQKPKYNGGSAPCTVRFSCAQPGEPGCVQTFAHRRDRMRHRSTVCEYTRSDRKSQQGFRCCCTKTIKRWYQFKKHRENCNANSHDLSPYMCQCGVSFNKMSDLEKHHKSEMGKAGRPRKSLLSPTES